jgi:hypothetical protein
MFSEVCAVLRFLGVEELVLRQSGEDVLKRQSIEKMIVVHHFYTMKCS